MSDLPTCRSLVWRLRVVMAERNIKTVTDLAHRLNQHGIEISTQQLTRVVNGIPVKLTMELLAGLVEVLNCGVADIIGVNSSKRTPEPEPAEREVEKSSPRSARSPRKRRPGTMSAANQNATEYSLTGPVVRAVLLPEQK